MLRRVTIDDKFSLVYNKEGKTLQENDKIRKEFIEDTYNIYLKKRVSNLVQAYMKDYKISQEQAQENLDNMRKCVDDMALRYIINIGR